MNEKIETIMELPIIIKSDNILKFLCNNCNGIVKIEKLGVLQVHFTDCLKKHKNDEICRNCFISTNKYYDCPYCNNRKFIEISESNYYY